MEDTHCGWGKCRPKYLQRFAHINVFLFFISMFSTVQVMLVNAFTSASIPHLENEFGLSSKQMGFIIASNDISGILTILFVSFYGGRGHKPKWLGYGAIVTGIGAFLFILPKIIKGSYNPTISTSTSVDDLCQSKQIIALCKENQSSLFYITLFFIGDVIMGLGATPLFSLGAAYLDENVSPKNSPVYLGIWYLCTFLGPALGYFIAGKMLNSYTDLGEVPRNLHPNHPLWAGRWWLGFVIFSLILVVNGIILLSFPRSLPGTADMRKKAIADGYIEDTNHDLDVGGIKGFIKATLNLIKNKTLVLGCLAISARMLIAGGIGSFFPKFSVIKFGASQKFTNYYFGLILLGGTVFGLGTGSFLMRYFKVQGSVKKAALVLGICAVSGAVTGFEFSIPGCETVKLVGVNIPSNVSIPKIFDTSTSCNRPCNCNKNYYNPVCSKGMTYFSPCFAGCKSITKDKESYFDCGCIRDYQNHTNASSHGSVKLGKCDQQCKNLILFVAVTFVIASVAFVSVTPNAILVLRSVPDNQRAFALGFQFLILRSLSYLPGPVLVGTIIDSTCIYWKIDNCGKKANCAEYDIDKLSLYVSVAMATGATASGILYLFAWLSYTPPPTKSITERLNNDNTVTISNNDGYENVLKDDTKL